MTHKGEKPRHYRYYDFAMAAFVGILLLSNLIGAAKIATLWGFEFGAGVLFFPLSYVLGDVLTEVYGYARARRCVWMGFAAMLFMAFMAWAVVNIPPAPGWEGQGAYETVFGITPRIVLASTLAFWAGELANAFVMAKMKLMTKGKYLWTRTIGSTVVGQAVDSLIFYPIAFFGIWNHDLLVTVMVSNFFLKVGWEAVLTPVTYMIVGKLKKLENEDYYDTDTNFTPFKVEA